MIFKLSVALCAAVWLAVPAKAQTFKPFTSLRVIETERFSIIFPEESRRTALMLAAYADEVYDEVSSRLGVSLGAKLPVTITPHTDLFNGYFNPFPYNHIVLFDTPMDIEWTTYRDAFRGLFTHELTHAVSMNALGPVQSFLRAIFGAVVQPVGFNAPKFMVEGVTVSFESLDGFGRANDPLVKQRVRQAIRDALFLDPFQAAGVYDLPPLGNAYYEYGGLFSRYIQERFGMGKYGELWRLMGEKTYFSFDYYRHAFYPLFKTIYGLDFKTAWADFAASLTLTGLEDNSAHLIVGGEMRIGAMDAEKGRIFYTDSVSATLRAYDSGAGESIKIMDIDPSVSDIDVAADGGAILVSGYRYAGDLATAVATEYAIAAGRPTGRQWGNLYKARYFREGVVGIASDRQANQLAYIGVDGERTVLLPGDTNRLFSCPAPIDENRIAFIVALDGARRVGVYDFRTGTASLLRTDLPDDEARWTYIRDLRRSGGRLWFAYDHDDRFYKLGAIAEDEAGVASVVFYGTDFSGGVFSPVSPDGRSVYYQGAFATWDALMAYPDDEAAAVVAPLSLVPLPPLSPASSSAASELSIGSAVPAAVSPAEHAYIEAAYLNPFAAWLPLPLLRSDGLETRVDGVSVISYISDPTDTDTALIIAGVDWTSKMAEIDLSWTSLAFGWPLTMTVSDGLAFAEGIDLAHASRATGVKMSLLYDTGLGNERTRLGLAPSLSGFSWAPNPNDGSGAYEWVYAKSRLNAGLTASLSFNRRRTAWQLFGTGTGFSLSANFVYPDLTTRLDALVHTGFKLGIPLRATAYASWDETGMNLAGGSEAFGNSDYTEASCGEYGGGGSDWLVGAELEALVFSVESQTNLSHLYFNRLFGALSYRAAVYDSRGASRPGAELAGSVSATHSLVVKAGAVMSAIPAAAVPVNYAPYIWGALKLANLTDDNYYNDISYGFGLDYRW